MQQKTYDIALDMKRVLSNPEHELVEGDTGNVFRVTLTDSGLPVDLTGCLIVAVISTPKGTAEQDSNGHGVTVEGPDNNVIRIELNLASFSPGDGPRAANRCEIQVYSGENHETLVTSAWFNFSCRRSIMNDDTIRTVPEYPILSAMIRDLTGLKRGVQADWAEADGTDPAYIKNKPAVAAERHAAQHARGGSDPVAPEDIGAMPEDATPTPAAHAVSHGSGGADPLPPSAIGAAVVRRFTAGVPVIWSLTPAVEAETTVESGSAAVSLAAFLAAVENTPGTYLFTYDGTNAYWTLDSAEASLAAYGVTLTGAPADADTITVTYAETEPYTQQIAVTGVTASMIPKCDILFDDTDTLEERIAQKEAWLCVDDVESGAGTVTLICLEAAPETAFSIQMEVVS